MASIHERAPTRYSCHECREDSELVLSNRATPSVRELYEAHTRECRDCRRMHRTLYALYEGPKVPAPPTGIREEKQFHSVLRRMKEEAPQPWYHKLSLRFGVAALAASAAILTLTLFDVDPGNLLPASEPEAPSIANVTGAPGVSPDAGTLGEFQSGSASAIKHPAQSYGRVVGGNALILPPGDQVGNTSTFPVGTRLEVGPNDSLQVGLVGKIVANFTPGSAVEWTKASPVLVEVKLDRGMAAFRYDRKPSDPILQVRTPTAVVRVIGTVFTVQVDGDDNTIVSVLRGQVEVLDPKSNRLVAEVVSGYRYDAGKGTFDDVGKVEVQAALPLSNEVEETTGHQSDALAFADGRIPSSWNVPGLPQDPRHRTLAYVPSRPGTAALEAPSIRITGTTGAPDHDSLPPKPDVLRVEDEGSDLLDELMREYETTRRKELRNALEACRELYDSHETRYRAAKCLSSFISRYGDDPLAAEGYLLVGMLRMDYALDYKAAEVAFQTYLKRAPNGPHAEMALYRMWLSSTEDGRISEALERGRHYLERYPNGRYVGKVLQRFPELKSEI